MRNPSRIRRISILRPRTKSSDCDAASMMVRLLEGMGARVRVVLAIMVLVGPRGFQLCTEVTSLCRTK